MSANIARHLERMAAAQPSAAAVKIPKGRRASGEIDYLTLSFLQLAAEADGWAERFQARGLNRGDRALVMVRPGLPLIASAFALFKLGVVPIIIDPGMGLSSFLSCVKRTKPSALVGIPLAQGVSRIFRGTFGTVRQRIPVNGSLTAMIGGRPKPMASVESRPDETAAVLFTSGSTGAPKGVVYEHGMFEAQLSLIRDTYGIEPGEIDLPLLPLFALFNPALGMTSVIPEIDPRRPAAADPARLVQAIRQEKVTNSFGSPTLWRKISGYCRAQALPLHSLRRVLCAGAPVPRDLWESSSQWMPNGRLYSPYGATEALPLTSLSSDDIDLDSIRGACVGRPVQGIRVGIIEPVDGEIPGVAEARQLSSNTVGEIIASGPVVTKAYDHLDEATRLAKIPDPESPNGLWHRMGDCGFVDEAGRLWFCGRKAERVPTEHGMLYTEPCEQVFRIHPFARRCALIGISLEGPFKVPALVIEGNPREKDRIALELRELGKKHPHTRPIRRFYFKARFPVDVRHNAKIHRLRLAVWAATAPFHDCA